MSATARRRGPWLRIAATLLLATALAGCANQDLYELPDSPWHVVGRLPLPSINEGVDVMGNYAFVAGGQAGLHVVDISDPANPIWVDMINTTKYASQVRVLRTFVAEQLIDIALVMEGTEGITSYDVTDPHNVIDYQQGTTAVVGKGMYIHEPENTDSTYVIYQAEDWKGIRIFNSYLPDYPGTHDYTGVFGSTYGEAYDVFVKGRYAFVADDQMGLVVVDVGAQVYPLPVVGWHDTEGNAVALTVVGDCCYVADKRRGMPIFDISDPTNPEMIGHIYLDGWVLDVAVRDGYAFLAADDLGVHIVDVSDPTDPVYAGNVKSSNATNLCLTDDGLLLVTDEDDGLIILQGPGAFADARAPASVRSLAADPVSFNIIELNWFATGDDHLEGVAQSYDIRCSSDPIEDEDDWAAATPVAVAPPQPGEPCLPQTLQVTGLDPETTYHFAMKVADDAGRVSLLSNDAEATTPPEGTLLVNPGISADYGLTGTTFTYEVTYLDSEDDAPSVHEVIIDDGTTETAHDMTEISGGYQTGALFRYTTTLPVGQYSYYFHFDDGQGHEISTRSLDGPLVGTRLFAMGSPADEMAETWTDDDETQHVVLFADSVFAQPHEVLQVDWNALMGANPSTWTGDSLPVHGVTWYEAVAYCNALSVADVLTPAYVSDGTDMTWNREADGWRLPTEAEWECLCRAGTETTFYAGDLTEPAGADPVLDAIGWYAANSGDSVNTAGRKQANPEGLFDMSGNVFEWCWDWYALYPSDPALDPAGPAGGTYKVIRGGSWYHMSMECRSAAREKLIPDSPSDFAGLRVVRTVFSN
ncbi:MAG: SUMF1/EgtB/PvdO family nonheme iron enzyme [Candidatus Krumholzibacteriota bacterium]|nr:SUMF1/EgtB/PvdO family nonheme iron enzyme [Candidatus Krumholzibacteriota bacterium]